MAGNDFTKNPGGSAFEGKKMPEDLNDVNKGASGGWNQADQKIERDGGNVPYDIDKDSIPAGGRNAEIGAVPDGSERKKEIASEEKPFTLRS